MGPCQIAPVQIAKKIVLLPMWTIISISDLHYYHVVNERDFSRRPGVKMQVLVVSCAVIVGLQELLEHRNFMASIARKEHDYAATIDNLRRAIEYRPASELNMMMVTALAGAGEFAAAYEFIKDAETRKPANPMRAMMWQRDLGGLRLYNSELEQYSKRDPSHQLDTGTETEAP
ncbi:MAG: hypothetical protein IIA07_01980 [Proteobacteria bacterium]|nr:hypothetical protein [Pseudomonadota bacterium]